MYVVLEKTLENPLDCKEIQPVHHKGNQSWIFIGRTDAEGEAPILWPPYAKNWLKRPWCWERLKAGGEGDDRGWDGWMASPTWWTWVWVSSGSSWWTGKPGMLQSMGSQRVRRNWTELNWCLLMLSDCDAGEDSWESVLWRTRRSSQSVSREINPEYSFEGLMLKWKLQYFDHLKWTADSLEKPLMLGKIEGRRRREHHRMRWLKGITEVTNMSLGNLQEMVRNREDWCAALHKVTKSWTWLGDGTTTTMCIQTHRHIEIIWTLQKFSEGQKNRKGRNNWVSNKTAMQCIFRLLSATEA